MFTKTLAVATLAALPALATPGVNIYWGQQGEGSNRLRNYCDTPGFEYVTIGFINSSPEHDPSGLRYPGTNFAKHCISDKYQNPDNEENSNLLSRCGQIAADVRYCQRQGKKVLLSIGGASGSDYDYSISNGPEGEYFAEFIWEAFGPFNPDSDKPRPFDDNFLGADEGQEHFVFDGFDFDLEQKFSR